MRHGDLEDEIEPSDHQTATSQLQRQPVALKWDALLSDAALNGICRDSLPRGCIPCVSRARTGRLQCDSFLAIIILCHSGGLVTLYVLRGSGRACHSVSSLGARVPPSPWWLASKLVPRARRGKPCSDC